MTADHLQHPSANPDLTVSPAPAHPLLETRVLSVRTRRRYLLRGINLTVQANQVLGIIGPSGSGKSTLLKCLNQLIALVPELKVEGDVRFHDQSILHSGIDLDALRERIGMLFQQPVVFPKSIYQNVIFGVRRLGRVPRRQWSETAERVLREANLWEEVKDRLTEPAWNLSLGQQQRLCLARTLAVNPEVILMDEPTSALDPKSTEAIESLILQLKETRTVVLVTHNVEQARRVTDWLACLCLREGSGEIVETACCDALLCNPQCQEVIDYLSRS